MIDHYACPRILLTSLVLATSAVCSTAAIAQAPSASGLEEVVVTAERREQSLQSVPVAISALTATQLEKVGLTSVDSLGQGIAGLTITRYSQATQPFIRGVGSQSLNVGQEGAVATYVDGVYIGDSYALPFEFNNIERIEVLKGPQGTLYGRNATGGLINVITRTPQREPRVEASVGYGNYNTFRGAAYVTGGTERFAADLALFALDQGEGFGTFRGTGEDANYQREGGARAKLLFTPTDGDAITIAADYYRNDGDLGAVFEPFPGAVMVGGIVGTRWTYGSNADPVENGSNYSGGASIHYQRDFGSTTMTVISAFRTSVREQVLDIDATQLSLTNPCLCTQLDTLQNEIYFTGEAGALNWTTGIFTWYTDAEFDLAVRSGLIPAANINRLTKQTTLSYAAYTQGTYALTDRTNVTAGIRMTRDTRDVAGNLKTASGTLITTFTPDEQTSEAPSWRLSLDHHFTDDLMAYVSYNRGFRSGTYNTTDGSAPPVDDETIDAYEVGLKAELWGRRARVNLAVFKYDYKDIQLNSVGNSPENAGITSIYNAASAEMKGTDATFELAPDVPTGELLFTFGAAYLDAAYEDFPAGPINVPNAPTVGGNTLVLGDLSGNSMIRSPEWTYNAGISYAIPLGAAELSMSASYYHNDGFFWEPDNRLKQNAYDLINASVHLGFGADNKYRLGVWGKNLTDEEYDVYVAESVLGDQHSAGFPRTYGVSFDLAF